MIVGVIVHGKEWTDRQNGVAYQSMRATVWYDNMEPRVVYSEYESGYDDFYLQQAVEELRNQDVLWTQPHPNGFDDPLWRICQDRGIPLYKVKETGCTKRAVIDWGIDPARSTK